MTGLSAMALCLGWYVAGFMTVLALGAGALLLLFLTNDAPGEG